MKGCVNTTIVCMIIIIIVSIIMVKYIAILFGFLLYGSLWWFIYKTGGIETLKEYDKRHGIK